LLTISDPDGALTVRNLSVIDESLSISVYRYGTLWREHLEGYRTVLIDGGLVAPPAAAEVGEAGHGSA
jgi:hypothetical protein